MTDQPSGVLAVECPRCHAPVGERCRTAGTASSRPRVTDTHTSRYDLRYAVDARKVTP